jgi:Ca2+-binding EF-hand superfamily protein
MAIVFYEVARPRDSSGQRDSRSTNSDPTDKPADHEAETDRLMKDLDRDGDGEIIYDEVERAVQLRLFRRIDTDDDRVLDRDEVLKYVKQRR